MNNSSNPKDKDTTESSYKQEFFIDDTYTGSEAQFELAAEVIEQATESSPPRIKITFTSTGQPRTKYEFGNPIPFSRVKGSNIDDDGSLYMLPYGKDGKRTEVTFIPDKQMNGCWQPTTKEIAFTGEAEVKHLTSGESLSREYALLNDPENADCFPQGKFKFEETYRQGDKEVIGGFTLVVTDGSKTT